MTHLIILCKGKLAEIAVKFNQPKNTTMVAAPPKLKVRNVHFNFDKVPKHWILGSSIATNFVNSMHVVFPEGEKFFVRSVRRFSKDIKDEHLKKEINSSAQEISFAIKSLDRLFINQQYSFF